MYKRLNSWPFTYSTAATLSRLRPVPEARHDAPNPRPGCLAGTRVEVLNLLYDWVVDPTPGHVIFWLSGLAGTGKSTIAQSISEHLAQEGRLGASFFISRFVAERRDPNAIVCSIIYQLARYKETLRSLICRALREEPDLVDKPLQVQINQLLAQPICNGAEHLENSIVLVIDALDECNKDGRGYEGGDLLQLLSQALLPFSGKVKVIITSRLEPSIEAMFNKIGHKSYKLHEIEDSIVQGDIQRYLQVSFHDVAINQISSRRDNWPSSADMDTLVSRAGSLFVYASTVVKYVSNAGFLPPDRLRLLVAPSPTVASGKPYYELDSLYLQVLQSALVGYPDEQAQQASRRRMLLGCVVSVQSPVSPTALAHLLDIDIDLVRLDLGSMTAMLIVPNVNSSQTVRIFHPSFSDFLADSSRCSDNRFVINACEIHSRLALRCLQILAAELQYNICGLEDPFKLNSEVANIEKVIESQVSHALRYACRFWAVHLEFAEVHSKGLVSALRTFVSSKMLYLIELASVLEILPAFVDGLPRAEKWCSVRRRI